MDALRPLLVLALLAPAVAAQSVTVSVKDGKLSIKGSAGIDTFSVSGSRADGMGPPALDIVVTPEGDTTVNGSASPGVFTVVTSAKITLGGGADELEVLNFTGPDFPLTVNAGPGDDEVSVHDSTVGDFKYVGASGEDVLIVSDATLGAAKWTDTSGQAGFVAINVSIDTLTAKTGASSDSLGLTDVTVSGELVVTSGGGDDFLSCTGLTVSATTSMKAAGGSDSVVFLASAFGGDVSVVTAAGNDLVTFEDSALGAELEVTLGGGGNLLALISEEDSMLVAGSVTVKGGTANDIVALVEQSESSSLGVGEDLILELKSGENQLQQEGDVTVGNDLLLTAGGLDETLDCDSLQVVHDATFLLASGENHLVLNDCLIGNDLTVACGPDDDTVQLTGTTNVGGTETIDLGGGET